MLIQARWESQGSLSQGHHRHEHLFKLTFTTIYTQKGPSWPADSNPEASYCEETALIAAPACRPGT